ncbi:MAG: extensin family protein [Hyphomicrobium sp.]|nr:extensin family protein [Hyphomicrobium sp.]
MFSRRDAYLVLAFALLVLAACSSGGENFVAKREPWRQDEESACLASGVVRQSPWVQSRQALGGPSVCGAARPFSVTAAGGGRVTMRPAALLRCPMIPQVERWVAKVVEPSAQYYFGAPLVEMKVAASYACRPINHQSGGRLSEHGYANALDISEFILADGRKITVKAGWWGSERERLFLRAVHDGACQNFTTVLGPNADRFHHDHFHMDLARHGRDGQRMICQ